MHHISLVNYAKCTAYLIWLLAIAVNIFTLLLLSIEASFKRCSSEITIDSQIVLHTKVLFALLLHGLDLQYNIVEHERKDWKCLVYVFLRKKFSSFDMQCMYNSAYLCFWPVAPLPTRKFLHRSWIVSILSSAIRFCPSAHLSKIL